MRIVSFSIFIIWRIYNKERGIFMQKLTRYPAVNKPSLKSINERKKVWSALQKGQYDLTTQGSSQDLKFGRRTHPSTFPSSYEILAIQSLCTNTNTKNKVIIIIIIWHSVTGYISFQPNIHNSFKSWEVHLFFENFCSWVEFSGLRFFFFAETSIYYSVNFLFRHHGNLD